jgi:sugar phosphate permease
MKTSYLGELGQNWIVLIGVFAAVAFSITVLPLYTFGVFFKPIQAELGWSRTVLSTGPLVVTFTVALVSPLIGLLADRIGEKPLIFGSMPLMAVCYFMLGRTSSVGSYYGCLFILGLLGAGCSGVTLTRIISASFVSARGTALGIVLCASGVAAALAPSSLETIIQAHGWRAAYTALAITLVVATPLVALCLRSYAPSTRAALTTGSRLTQSCRMNFSEVLRSGTFWLLAVAFVSVALAVTGALVHFVPMLIDRGFAPASAAKYAGLIGISSLTIRIVAGLLVDRIAAPIVGAVIMLVSATGFIALGAAVPGLEWFGALCIGVALGTEIDLASYLCSRYFGVGGYGRAYGALYALLLVGTGVSPLLYAFLFEQGYGYNATLCGATVLLLLSCATFGVLAYRERFNAGAMVQQQG